MLFKMCFQEALVFEVEDSEADEEKKGDAL